MAKAAADSWPPAQGLFSPTVSRADVVVSINGKITIQASAATVWKVLLDTSTYKEWNPFVPEVTVHSQADGSDSELLKIGTDMTFQAVMDPKKPAKKYPTHLKVVDISTPEAQSTYISDDLLQDPVFTADLSKVYRISWKLQGVLVGRGLRSERFHEIIVLDDNSCEVRNWECMGGFLARSVKWMYGTILPVRCMDWLKGLKEQSENMSRSEPMGERSGGN